VSIGRDRTGLGQLSTLFNLGTVDGLTDGQLLERFTAGPRGAAEGAFAALIERHGSMVLQTCRGVLSEPHDAEDAFQATFLVLVKKARGLWVQDSLGPWLHQVAFRTATAARAASIRRQGYERRMAASVIVAVSPSGERAEPHGEWERRVLHEEIVRLPERYRVPMVLCGLEGLTQEQAAQRLRWPVGTVKSRLARGREKLRVRLTRRGLAPATGLAASVAAESIQACVPSALAKATIHAAQWMVAGQLPVGAVSAAALDLMKGTIRVMLAHKLRNAVIVVALPLGVVIACLGTLPGPRAVGGSKTTFAAGDTATEPDKLVLAAALMAPAASEAIPLTPDTIAKHGYHLRVEPVDHARNRDDAPARPTAPVIVHLRFGRLPGGAVEELEPIKDVSLVIADDGGVKLSVPVRADVDPGNRVHLYVRFSTQREQLQKLRLVFDEEDGTHGRRTFVADLGAFIKK